MKEIENLDAFRDKNGLSLEDHLAIEGKIPAELIDYYADELFMYFNGIKERNEFGKQMTTWNRQLHVLLSRKLKLNDLV